MTPNTAVDAAYEAAKKRYPNLEQRHRYNPHMSREAFVQMILEVEQLRVSRYPFCPVAAWDVIQADELFDTFMGEPLFGFMGVPMPEWAVDRELWERQNLIDKEGWSTPEANEAAGFINDLQEAIHED